MIIHLPVSLETSILKVVRRCRFPSIDEAMAEAATDLKEVEPRLLTAGALSETRPPIGDPTPSSNRRNVVVRGEPPSGTTLRERR
ncbi:MAG: hypothetical protein U0790_15700 [Isosphaeraceae bacterium]